MREAEKKGDRKCALERGCDNEGFGEERLLSVVEQCEGRRRPMKKKATLTD